MAILENIFGSRHSSDENFFYALKKILGFKPKDITIYQEAFTHRSMNTLHSDGRPQSYERMEFLGDAMLSAVIASHLYNKVPTGDEGYLTKMLICVVPSIFENQKIKSLFMFLTPLYKMTLIAYYFSFQTLYVYIRFNNSLINKFFAKDISPIKIYSAYKSLKNISMDIYPKLICWYRCF